jgi:hypothetical protein
VRKCERKEEDYCFTTALLLLYYCAEVRKKELDKEGVRKRKSVCERLRERERDPKAG